MTLEDVATEDTIAAGVWGVFTAWSGFKFVAIALAEPNTLQLISPLVGTICGAIIGYRHVQNLAAISRERIQKEREAKALDHQLEMARLGQPVTIAPEFGSKFAFDATTAKPSDDTVDVP